MIELLPHRASTLMTRGKLTYDEKSAVVHRVEEREFFMDNLLVRIHFVIRWTGLAPCECEFPFSGSLTAAFLVPCGALKH